MRRARTSQPGGAARSRGRTLRLWVLSWCQACNIQRVIQPVFSGPDAEREIANALASVLRIGPLSRPSQNRAALASKSELAALPDKAGKRFAAHSRGNCRQLFEKWSPIIQGHPFERGSRGTPGCRMKCAHRCLGSAERSQHCFKAAKPPFNLGVQRNSGLGGSDPRKYT